VLASAFTSSLESPGLGLGRDGPDLVNIADEAL
jgi:hypothetical protein